jgi:hypothetical protein
MPLLTVNYFSKKAQLKIQQMALVLVITMIFFGMIGVVFASIWFTSLADSARRAEENEAQKMVASLAGTPELIRTEGSEAVCSSCIDLQKALLLKTQSSYKKFWNFDYFQIVRVFPPPPKNNTECTLANFPDCDRVTITTSEFFGKTSQAHVTLVRFVPDKGGYFKREMGRVLISKNDTKYS